MYKKSKLPGEKRLSIPPRTNFGRYIPTIHGFSSLVANSKPRIIRSKNLFRPTDVSIVKKNIHSYEKPCLYRPDLSPPRPPILPGQKKKNLLTKHPDLISVASPAAAVAVACHGVRSAMPLDLIPSGRKPTVFSTAADSPRLSHARFLPPLIFQQQNAHGYCSARPCSTKQTPGRGHTAGGRVAYRRMCRYVSARFRLPPLQLSPQPTF